MNGKTDNITLHKHEYNLIIAYRKASKVEKTVIDKILDIGIKPKQNKVIELFR